MIIKWRECTVNAKLGMNFVGLCNDELHFWLLCTCACTKADQMTVTS